MIVGSKGDGAVAVVVALVLTACADQTPLRGTQPADNSAVTTLATTPITGSPTTATTVPDQTATSNRQRSSIDPMAAPLLGLWVQDDAGPVLTYQRRFQFNPDGSYQFLVASRNSGSVNETIVAREDGMFRVQGNQLLMQPRPGSPRTVLWRVDRDPYAGDTRFVIELPDGTLDVYYRS